MKEARDGISRTRKYRLGEIRPQKTPGSPTRLLSAHFHQFCNGYQLSSLRSKNYKDWLLSLLPFVKKIQFNSFFSFFIFWNKIYNPDIFFTCHYIVVARLKIKNVKTYFSGTIIRSKYNPIFPRTTFSANVTEKSSEIAFNNKNQIPPFYFILKI